MPYKFEQLEVWKLALDYIDLVYKLAENLPRSEDFNLKSQITRAATSVALKVKATQSRPAFLACRFVRLLKQWHAKRLFVEEHIFKTRLYSIKPMKTLRRLPGNYNPFESLFLHIKSKKNRLFMEITICNSVQSSTVYGLLSFSYLQ